ncbi:MAG: oligosaccharide flippase family protein [Bacilli bacterium]
MQDKKINTVLRAGMGYTIGNYLIKGLSFFSIPIFSRLMSANDYGQYNTFVAYESILFVFIGLALHSSFKNAKYKFGNRFDSYMASMYTVALISLSVWILIVNITYNYLGFKIGFSREIVNLLLICSFGSAIIQYYNAYISLDYRYKQFLVISGFNAISNIVISVFFIITMYKTDTYIGRILGTVIPILIIIIYIISSSFQKSKPNLNKEYIKYGVLYSIPIIPHGISQVILSQFDRIMINSIIGSTEAGIYSFAYNIYVIIQVTTNSLDNAWSPWFYEMMNLNKTKKIKEISSIYMTGMMIFASVIMLFSPEIIKFLSPPSYWDAIYSVIPIVVGGYLAYLYLFPVQVEYYYEKTGYIAFGTCMAALINIILNAYFIPKYGYIAAAYTTLATYFLYFIFHFFLSYLISKEKLFSCKIIVFNIVCISIIGVVSLLLINNFIGRLIIAIFIIVITFYCYNKQFKIANLIKNKLNS